MLHIYNYVNGIRKQNADSPYNLRIPRNQFADLAYSWRIRNSSIQVYKYLIIWFWIPRTVLSSAKSPIFGAILSGTVF